MEWKTLCIITIILLVISFGFNLFLYFGYKGIKESRKEIIIKGKELSKGVKELITDNKLLSTDFAFAMSQFMVLKDRMNEKELEEFRADVWEPNFEEYKRLINTLTDDNNKKDKRIEFLNKYFNLSLEEWFNESRRKNDK